MAVDVERRLGRRVSQTGLDDLHRGPGSDERAGEVVAQIVRRRPVGDTRLGSGLLPHGQPIPAGGVPALVTSIASLCTGLLLQEWKVITVFTKWNEHRRALVRILETVQKWGEAPTECQEALRILRAQRAEIRGSQ